VNDASFMSILTAAGNQLADRFRIAGVARRALKRIFPDHWSFFIGELALYSFVILVLTGTYLALFFHASMTEMIYHGRYTKLDGVRMSEAYNSTLNISFDVRGGLLVRQIHHWAANVFIVAICVHMIRVFLSGAFRRPREINWIIGVIMFALSAVEGFFGYSLPDDLLSGTGVRIAQGIMLSVPVIGTYISYFAFGGQYPGTEFIGRFFIAHVFIVPGILIALIGAHLAIIWYQGHTQWPGKRQRENNEVGDPMFPIFTAKTTALFLFVTGVLTLLATFFQVNPVWSYGPYDPVRVSAGSQPDWYVGFMEGSLRIMPNWITNVGGYTLAWNVFLAAAVLPAAFFLLAGVYPAFEEWAVGDLRHHQILDRPRNAPGRTALGVAIIAMGADLLLAGSDDLITNWLQLSIFGVVWFFRVGFFAFPVIGYFVTRHICRVMQAHDRRRLRAGTEFGIAVESGGGFAPVSRPVSEEERYVLEAHRPEYLIAPYPRHLLPLPTARRIRAQIRARLNHFYTLDRLETRYGHGQMELAEFNPPERQDGSVWPPDGGHPVGDGHRKAVNGVKHGAGRGQRAGGEGPRRSS
jgi:ubiquinol-cytochrome c reductase cytochrome b subunit